MLGIDLLTHATTGPSDTSGLRVVRDGGHRVDDILAVVGKTEGNGCVNDFSRTLGVLAWQPLVPPAAISLFSGGTEGVLSPHVNLFVLDRRLHKGFTGGLVAAAGRTRPIEPHELGRRAQIELVADKVTVLVANLQVAPDDVHFVLVKCPLLTPDRCAQALAEGHSTATADSLESMGRSRAASALGVAVALGECSLPDAEGALAGRCEVWSSRASASSGAELDVCEILVVALSASAANPLRAVHGVMRDAMDLETVQTLMEKVRADDGTVVQIFAKAEADGRGLIRGRRHTMLTDSDLSSTRHARCAVGGLLVAVRGHGGIYVSGGAEHQGPPGGGSITIFYRVLPP